MNGCHRKPTMKDIAEATGYSINTVSRALRGEKNIAPETLQKILQAKEQLGYISNTLASSLRTGHSKTISVILGDVANPFFGIQMSEVESRARMYGYASFLQTTSENDNLERNMIQSAINRSVDGILLCPCQKSETNIRYLLSTGIPFVLFGRRCHTMETDYVVCNDEMGGYQATSALLRKGHTRILLLQGPPYVSSAYERKLGYLRAHAEAGLEADPRLIRETPIMGESNEALYKQILSEDLGFTAVFAFSDLIAWNFWRFLNSRGYSVPKDFSIVGFDNIQSRLPVPLNLTSVDSHKEKISTIAVDILVQRMRSMGTMKPIQTVIDPELYLGETVGKPALHGSGKE